MSAHYNSELVEEKLKTIHSKIGDVREEIKAVNVEVNELENMVKKEYTPLTTTSGIDKRVIKFENMWEWGMKIILGAMIAGILAIIGLR